MSVPRAVVRGGVPPPRAQSAPGRERADLLTVDGVEIAAEEVGLFADERGHADFAARRKLTDAVIAQEIGERGTLTGYVDRGDPGCVRAPPKPVSRPDEPRVTPLRRRTALCYVADEQPEVLGRG